MRVKLRSGIPRIRREIEMEMLPAWLKDREVSVIAVKRNYGDLRYLLYGEQYNCPSLDWFLAKYFEVLDDTYPEYWVERRWPIWHPYVKKSTQWTDFGFRLTYYHGPSIILDDADFLFNVVEDRRMAMDFYYKHLNR